MIRHLARALSEAPWPLPPAYLAALASTYWLAPLAIDWDYFTTFFP